jgi:hypothetical protein
VFKLLTITPVVDYLRAIRVAREMELCKGEFVRVTQLHVGSSTFEDFEDVVVIDVRAVSNAKRVLGATGSSSGGGAGGVPGGGAETSLLASVDAEWTLQVIPV